MDRILTHLLTAPTTLDDIDTIDAWSAMHKNIASAWPSPAERAFAAGFAADRVAWAFASGYRAALAALAAHTANTANTALAALAASIDARVALAVTEDAGNAPRAIRTTVRDAGDALVVDGTKSFITLGTHAEEIWVLARFDDPDTGTPTERPHLVVVRVPTNAPHLTLTALAPLPFVPEVSHARATFTHTRVPHTARLAGDGWSDYVKPFRTVEDVHVHAALLGHLVAISRRAPWPDDTRAHLAALVVSTHALCHADRDAPATHVALDGVISAMRTLAFDDALWDLVDAPTRARWHRDRALLAVAAKARASRLARAWERLATPIL